MSYIAREEGEGFIVPSYRDILNIKKKSLLKREIELLSINYGEYIHIHHKNASQYEVIFSQEAGYPLGETVLAHFKNPLDMIYCEEIPNTAEAILVIAKAGSVFIDGKFPIDSLIEEFITLQTQQNNFDIFIHGNIPLTETPEDGKFTFAADSVKSFQILPEPIFEKLPVISSLQLNPVPEELRAVGISNNSSKIILAIVVIVLVSWIASHYFEQNKKSLPTSLSNVVDSYNGYYNQLMSPAPEKQIQTLIKFLESTYTIPGWSPISVGYAADKYRISVKSNGARMEVLENWVNYNHVTLNIKTEGIEVTTTDVGQSREKPKNIYKLQEVIAHLVDRFSYVIPGNNMTLGTEETFSKYKQRSVTVNFSNVSFTTLNLIGQQFHDLPLSLSKIEVSIQNNLLSGSIMLTAVGN